jgi:CRISPR/Cas system-associated exonuclease Cas4 (RecB family)
VITPRVTRLVRVPDLRALHRTVLQLIRSAGESTPAVIVPTRGAAVQLARLAACESVTGLEVLTRDDLYARLSRAIGDAPPLLTPFEREVLLRLAAESARAAGAPPPFKLRPGLVVEILGFYDELRRNLTTIDDFHRLLTGELSAVADTDRGAERLLRQTEFLSAAFAEFERRVAAADRIDEHALRSILLAPDAPPTCSHFVVATADRAADEHGLWPADFDLLARLPQVRRIEVVATERMLASGFRQRLHERHLPGLEDVSIGSPSSPPLLVVPETNAARPTLTITCRDREEELVSFVRTLKDDVGIEPERAAVVFRRPLPYFYIARQVFGSAHVPFQALDSRPLAAEPIAAALDLVLTFVSSQATRGSAVALLESPHWTFSDPETRETVQRPHVDALDAWLRESKFLGGWDQLHQSAMRSPAPPGLNASAAIALRAAAAAAAELEQAARALTASAQIDALLSFVGKHERLPAPDVAWHERHLRARAALLDGLAGLREAHRLHDDGPVPFADLAAAIRRWIEGKTFELESHSAGPFLLDATAAAFTDLDVVRLVGLVDGDWPERATRSIFFPPRVLEPLGWPSPTDRLSAERARFQDLLLLPRQAVSASTFSLEDDAIVTPSAFVEEIASAGLVVRQDATRVPAAIFDHDALSGDPVDSSRLDDDLRRWLAFRQQRAPAESPQFHGYAGKRAPATYAVSHLERYLACPFKYFAERVLRLDEEREQESGLTPQERGQFLHRVFESFFEEWSAAGYTTITAESLEAALAMFEAVAERHLGSLREADRALERTYLLGSAVAPGLAERAFASEIEHGVGVAERLLEHPLEGRFTFVSPAGCREISLRAKADRIDLLEDGTLRILDYKIGRAPKLSRSLQLPVYSVCAQQALEGRHGRQWTIARAGYIAFKEKNAFVSIGVNLEKALGEGQERLTAAVDGIEEGNFPPRPDEPWLCSRCGYSLVCRKDYVGDD